MAWKQIFKTLEFFLYILSLLLILPLAVSIYFEFISHTEHLQPYDTSAFVITLIVCLLFALCCRLAGRGVAKATLYRREGILAVLLIWLLTPALSALPFLINGTLDHFEDAYFEMCSGYTTTGSSILYPKKYNQETGAEEAFHVKFNGIWDQDTEYIYFGTVTPIKDPHSGAILHEGVEALGKGLLFWRSLTQWIGGIGIILLFVAVIPTLEMGAKVLFQSEIVGPIKETIATRTQDTALLLFKIYFCITVAQVIALIATNFELPFFDAMNIAFTTVSSGGFSVRNASIASYNNAATEWVTIIFMMLGTINFSLFYFLIKKKFERLKDVELTSYLAIALIFATITCWKLIQNMPNSWTESIRYGTFQIVSTLSTTGFAIADYDFWPDSVQVLMLISMYIGGMSGSTAGGIKVIRYYLLAKIAIHRIEAVFRPEGVRSFNYGASRINADVASNVQTFFFIYIFIAVAATLIYVFSGVDPETSLSVSSCMLNNIGAGFRMVGPDYSCAFLSTFGKYFSCLLMFLGRLELFILLILFLPSFWRRI